MNTAEDSGNTNSRSKIVQLPDARGASLVSDRGRTSFPDLTPLISEAHTSKFELSQWRKLFEQIVARESGTYDLEIGIPRFLKSLGAGPVQRQQLGELFEFLGGYQPSTLLENRDAAKQIIGLHSARAFLRWYTTRLSVREAYLALQEARGVDVKDALKLDDEVFSLRLEHDASLSGVPGMFVCTSQCWKGRAGEVLWAETTLSTGKGPVEVAPGWEAWSYLDASGTPFPREVSRSFVSVLPLRPNSQELFVDEVRLFVPYAALKLQSGKQKVNVTVRVRNRKGHELARCQSDTSFSVPSPQGNVSPISSPQQLGYWREDPVTRTGFLHTRVERCTHSVGHDPIDTLRVRSELRVFAETSRSLLIECRLLDDEGVPVTSALPEFADSKGRLTTSCLLSPSSSCSVLSPVDLELPLCAAQLDSVSHQKQPFFVELLVRTDDGRVVCGAQELVPPHFFSHVLCAPAAQTWQKTRDVLCSESLHQIADLTIDPLFPFGSTKAFRVCCQVDSPVSSELPYGLKIEIALEGGQKRLTRLLHFLPGEDSGQTLVGCYGVQEILSLYPAPSHIPVGAQKNLLVTASLLDTQGVQLHVVEQLVDAPPYDAPMAPIPKPRSPAYISDMVTTGGLLGGDVKATFRLDLDCGAPPEETLTLYTEIVSSEGREEEQEAKVVLPGTISQLSFSELLKPYPRRSGWIQEEVHCAPELSSNDLEGKPVLKVMLFARDGRLLQVLRQPLAAEHWDFPYEGVLSHSPEEQRQRVSSRVAKSRFWPKLKDFIPKA